MDITQLSTLWQCIIVVVCQFAYSTTRTKNIQDSIDGGIVENIVSNFLVVLTWLISLSIGLKGMLDGNIAILCSYLFTAAIGNVPLLIKQGRPLFKHKTN